MNSPDPAILRQLEEYKAEERTGRSDQESVLDQLKQITWAIFIFSGAALAGGLAKDVLLPAVQQRASQEQSRKADSEKYLSQSDQLQSELSMIARELNKQLPMTLNNPNGAKVTVQAVVAGASSLDYHFMSDVSAEQLSANAPSAIDHACSEMLPLLNRGVTIRYIYRRSAQPTNVPTFDLAINKESCRSR